MEKGRTPRGQLNNTGSLTNPKTTKKHGKSTGPPKAGAFAQKRGEGTSFKMYYERGDIPVKKAYSDSRSHSGPKLHWMAEIEKLDYHHYLPLFFEGLRETDQPYATIATQGAEDMLSHAPAGVVNVVPQLILPLKNALDTRNPEVMCRAIKAIQRLVDSDELVGEALVPYYRQLLPTLNAYKCRNINTGDGIEYSQSKNNNIGDLIENTLQQLERAGGEDAYINIKYMVPTYESCVLN